MPHSSISTRFSYGLAAACLACLILGHFALVHAVKDIARERAERSLLIAAHALADVAERASGSRDVRRAAVRIAGHHPQVRSVRVVTLAERELMASTLEEGGPRPLQPAERPLFETAERLRLAVVRNRAARGHERAEEAARHWFDYREDPVVSVTVPFERGGQVVGAVEIESFVELKGLESFEPPLWIFLLVPLLVKTRRVLAIGTTILLCVFLWKQAEYMKQEIDSRREQMAEHVVQALATESEQAASLLAEIGAPAYPPLAPLSWDTDFLGWPTGLATTPGVIDPAKLVLLQEADGRRRIRTTLALFLLGFTILGIAGFYRTGREEPEARGPG